MVRKKLFALPPRAEGNLPTLQLINSFCDLIVRGLSPSAACDYLTISTEHYYLWLRSGSKLIRAGQTEELKAQFVLRYQKAFATYQLDRVDRLHDPVNRNWYRELAILERRDRKTYGRQEQPGGSDDSYDPDERFL